MQELRMTDTNSANDQRGRALGFDGNDFIYVLVAFVLALGAYLVLAFLLQAGQVVSVGLSSPLFGVTLVWLWFFRRGKPEGYAEDLIEQWMQPEGWSSAPIHRGN